MRRIASKLGQAPVQVLGLRADALEHLVQRVVAVVRARVGTCADQHQPPAGADVIGQAGPDQSQPGEELGLLPQVFGMHHLDVGTQHLVGRVNRNA